MAAEGAKRAGEGARSQGRAAKAPARAAAAAVPAGRLTLAEEPPHGRPHEGLLPDHETLLRARLGPQGEQEARAQRCVFLLRHARHGRRGRSGRLRGARGRAHPAQGRIAPLGRARRRRKRLGTAPRLLILHHRPVGCRRPRKRGLFAGDHIGIVGGVSLREVAAQRGRPSRPGACRPTPRGRAPANHPPVVFVAGRVVEIAHRATYCRGRHLGEARACQKRSDRSQPAQGPLPRANPTEAACPRAMCCLWASGGSGVPRRSALRASPMPAPAAGRGRRRPLHPAQTAQTAHSAPGSERSKRDRAMASASSGLSLGSSTPVDFSQPLGGQALSFDELMSSVTSGETARRAPALSIGLCAGPAGRSPARAGCGHRWCRDFCVAVSFAPAKPDQWIATERGRPRCEAAGSSPQQGRARGAATAMGLCKLGQRGLAQPKQPPAACGPRRPVAQGGPICPRSRM